MSPSMTAVIAFAIIFGAGVVGSLLPGHRLPEATKDVVRLGAGLLATVVGLVLGLMIASASTSFDTQNNQVRQITSNVILLDSLLNLFGPDAQKARIILRASIPPFVDAVWKNGSQPTAAFKPSAASEALYFELEKLDAKDDTQKSIKSRVSSIYGDLLQTRVLLLQKAGGGIPTPFIAVIIIWLALIFFSYGLLVDHHQTVLVALFVVAASTSAALLLILELTHPFDGLLQIPNEPVLNALAPLAR